MDAKIWLGMMYIVPALVFYSIAIWSERSKRILEPWMVLLFVIAFLCDLIGTSIMFVVAETKFSLAIHSIAGYLALAIMLGHLIWALKVAIQKSEKAQRLFTKYSIVAWIVWIVAFISGIPRM